eukprot:c16627_g1_i1.p1 GENE.c16627_g1_i1~~c16627_g1_i1.p1  ORF type:complete len:113 (+),score=33.48 c16627_g1_i1:30-341(+)
MKFFFALLCFLLVVVSLGKYSHKDKAGNKEKIYQESDFVHLVGKKFVENSDQKELDETTFSSSDVPDGTRIVRPGVRITKDFRPERVNVFLNEEGVASSVQLG